MARRANVRGAGARKIDVDGIVAWAKIKARNRPGEGIDTVSEKGAD